jgi:mannose-6-phosphate isomerase-like protein (cupin superfamily)
MEKIKFPWGELTIVGETKELSVGVDIIFPGCQIGQKGMCLKKGLAIYYVLEGKGLCGKRKIKKGDLLKITAGKEIYLKNDGSKNLGILTIYMPPFDEGNIGFLIS